MMSTIYTWFSCFPQFPCFPRYHLIIFFKYCRSVISSIWLCPLLTTFRFFHNTRLFLLIGFFRGQNISSRKKIFFLDFSLAVSKYQWAVFSAPWEGPSSRNARTIISENTRCFFLGFYSFLSESSRILSWERTFFRYEDFDLSIYC